MPALSSQQLLRIGEVAGKCQLPIKTVRYYDEFGLLTPTVQRSESGYRLFDDRVLSRLAFIKRAQSLGLSLGEIRDILQVHDRGELPCGEVKHYLQDKVQTITQQIAALELLRTELQSLLADWEEHPSAERAEKTICPNLQSEIEGGK